MQHMGLVDFNLYGEIVGKKKMIMLPKFLRHLVYCNYMIALKWLLRLYVTDFMKF